MGAAVLPGASVIGTVLLPAIVVVGAVVDVTGGRVACVVLLLFLRPRTKAPAIIPMIPTSTKIPDIN